MTVSKKSKVNRRWLVENRSKVQERLLALDELAPLVVKSKAIAARALFNMMVGVSFSLWRAVFLIQTDYDLDSEHDHAVELLGILVETNAVGFPQDKQTANWTAGYYINNAAFRLHAMATLRQTKLFLLPATASWLENHMNPRTINSHALDLLDATWEELLNGFDMVLADLRVAIKDEKED
jgi:hypothetical protein